MRIRAIRLVANYHGICLILGDIQKALEYLEGGNELWRDIRAS